VPGDHDPDFIPRTKTRAIRITILGMAVLRVHQEPRQAAVKSPGYSKMRAEVETSVAAASPAHPDDVASETVSRPDPTGDSQLLTVICPPQCWSFVNVRELWQHRELVGFLVWRDVKIRYKQTLLGAAWAVLQPALMMIVFTIVFGRMARVPSGGLPYPLFAYAGLLPWTFFATAVANGGNSVVGSERLITKIYFPRLAIPLGAVGAAVVDFVVACGLLVVLMLYYGVTPGPGMLLIPVIFAPIAVIALGVGTLLAALNVSYRDFRYVIPFLVQLWMFATPTVYMQVSTLAPAAPLVSSSAATPETSTDQKVNAVSDQPTEDPDSGLGRGTIRALLTLNPMTDLIGAFRSAALGGPISWAALARSSAGALALLLIGVFYFRQVEDRLADVI
jgi:lipopolysaccharide transport system permease protein